uniref:response regulator n=1 Tax=Halobacillus amylolyticus TaxID=2932259 RepID=UPI0029624580|nr:response regulator [Halobacillus amylolyticus]
MNKPRVLIIEDEEKIARVLELELSYEGYEAVKAFDGVEGLKKISGKSWGLLLLDVMLPSLGKRLIP